MSFYLYDKALGDKIKGWVLDKSMKIFYPDETKRLFQQVADDNQDKISLPLIAISRDRNVEIRLKNRRYGQQTGKTFRYNDQRADHLNYIPITLRYQIDIYTRYREEAEEYVRNFIFNIINYPSLKIAIPYHKSELQQSSFIELEGTIRDNSDIPERLVPGQFTRITLEVVLRDACLYSYTVEEIPKITSVDVGTSDCDLSISPDLGEDLSHHEGDKCEHIPVSLK